MLHVCFLFLLLCSCVSHSIRVAEFSYKDGDYTKAVEEYTKVVQKSNKPQYKYNLALSYLAQERNLEAVALLKSLLEKYPRNVLILRTKLVVLHTLGDYENAKKIVDQLFLINPNNFYARLYSLYLLCEEKKCEQSLLGMKKLYKETRNTHAILVLSKIAEKMLNLKEAIFWLDKYVKEVSTTQATYFFQLAQWQIQEKDYLGAINSLEKGLRYDEDPKQRYKLAYIYLIFLSNPKQGISNLEKAVHQGFDSQKDLTQLFENPRLGNRSEVEKTLYRAQQEYRSQQKTKKMLESQNKAGEKSESEKTFRFKK